MSTSRALTSTGTLERLDQRAGVEGGSGGRQVCLLGFSHTMNQVKSSAPDGGRLKAEQIADPKETAGSYSTTGTKRAHFFSRVFSSR